MKKQLLFSLAAVAALAFTSCSDDDNGEPWVNEYTGPDVTYVLTQGNFYGSEVKGGLNVIDNQTYAVGKNVFSAANGRSLGDTPQCGVAYGSKIYVGVYKSNTIEIMDAKTYEQFKQIKLSEDPSNGTQPRSMVAYNGKVYISMYDGFLARLDTLTMTIDKSVAVGPNPENIALHNGKIYVPVSDGMNYPTYGKTACIVDPVSMAKEREFNVGVNPDKFISADGNLFLLCKGNYTEIGSKLYRINADLTSTEICDATIAAAMGDDVFVVNQPFSATVTTPEYYEYDVDSAKLEPVTLADVDYANQVYFDDRNDLLFVSSYVMNGMYPSYDLPGYVNVYDDDFRFIKRCDIGSAGPAFMFSWKK